MYCEKCGNKLKEDSNLCEECGNKISKDENKDRISELIKEDEPKESLAGFWIRLGAYLIDYLVICLILLIIFIFFGDEDSLDNMSDSTAELIFFGSVLFYHMISLYHSSTTIGKSIFGLKVIDIKTGNKVSAAQAIARSLSYILSSIFYIGFIIIAFNKKKQGFHDQLAKTLVIRDNSKSSALGVILTIISVIILIYFYFLRNGRRLSS